MCEMRQRQIYISRWAGGQIRSFKSRLSTIFKLYSIRFRSLLLPPCSLPYCQPSWCGQNFLTLFTTRRWLSLAIGLIIPSNPSAAQFNDQRRSKATVKVSSKAFFSFHKFQLIKLEDERSMANTAEWVRCIISFLNDVKYSNQY